LVGPEVLELLAERAGDPTNASTDAPTDG
jgi:hypothetical protein